MPHFQNAIEEFPGYYEAYDRIGAADLQLWRIPEAEESFRKSIELSGEGYAHPLIALGAILNDHGNYAEAATVIRKGLDLAPDSWTGHYYLGLALFSLNRLDEAEKCAREALLRKANFPRVQLLLADIHNREKDYASLVSDLNEYLRLDAEGPATARARALLESVQRILVESQSASATVPSQP